jgi:hypothetical protein
VLLEVAGVGSIILLYWYRTIRLNLVWGIISLLCFSADPNRA